VSVAAALADGGRAVELSVTDTGSGIDPSLVPHVFDRFAKAADSRGSGLGLAIARGLVEAHGGTISLDSRPGAGSTFRIRIPLEGRPDG
jgi:signal transduction histidine kinase